MNNLAIRIIFALIATPIFVYSMYAGGYTRLAIFYFLGVGASWEFARMISGKEKAKGWQIIAPIFSFALIYSVTTMNLNLLIAVSSIVVLTYLIITFAQIDLEKIIPYFAMQIFGVFYFSVWYGTSSFLITSNGSMTTKGFESVMPFVIVMFLMFAADTAGYTFGRTLGKHQMAPKISPKKTWEGAIGGVFFTSLFSAGLAPLVSSISIVNALILGFAMSITAPLGDLLMSTAKRYAGVKDSSNIFPGHGGILDRFDSFFLSAPIAVVLLTLLKAF